MVTVNITPELVNDFNNLIAEFRIFMSLNMVKLESNGKTPDAKKKLLELVAFCNNNVNALNIFKDPIKNNMNYNIAVLSKDNKLNELIRLLHEILSKGSILKDYHPEMYNGRFTVILNLYVDFTTKYKIY